MNQHTFHIEEDDSGLRLDKFLSEQVAGLSRVQLQAMIKAGEVQVNAKAAKPALRLEAGDRVQVTLPEAAPAPSVEAEALPLDVLYEDEHLALINKAAGMVVHPALGSENGTLVNALLHRYPQVRQVGDDPNRVGIVHRLDKETSGLILVALTSAAQSALMAQFKARQVKKTYWALTERSPDSDTGRIDAPLGRSPTQRKKMAVVGGGRESETEFRVLQRFQPQALLEVYPLTGRTHQIRVHLAFINCPIVGDSIYGFRKPSLKSRLFLHAKAITFTHPATGESMSFDVALPAPLQQVLAQLAQD